MNDDLQHLRLLSIFHYVVGGLAGFFACFPVIYVVMGIAMVLGLFDQQASHLADVGKRESPPAALGWILIGMGSVFILLAWAFAISLIIAGRMLGQQRRYLFCLVMAVIACLFQPYGLVLGIFTILVLVRPSVKKLFASGASGSAVEGNDSSPSAQPNANTPLTS